jgi:hypothetical protein
MVPLPAAAGTPVSAVSLGERWAAALCGDAVYVAEDLVGWTRLCDGAVGVQVRGDSVFTGQERSVVAIDAGTGRRTGAWGPADAPLTGLGVSADGAHVALGEYRVATVWDVASGRRVARGRLHPRVVQDLDFAPDGRTLAARSFEDLAVWRWSSRLARPRRTHGGLGSGSNTAFAPGGELLGGLAKDRLGVWSARARPQRELAAGDYVRAVAIAPDGERVAARLSEGAVLVWSWPGGDRIAEHDADRMGRGVCFSPGGALLAAGDDAALMTWGEGVPEPAPERFVPGDVAAFGGTAPPSALDWDALTVDAVEQVARAAPWMTRLGAPIDGRAPQLGDWDEWPGPEDPACAELHHREGALRAAVDRAVRGLRRADVAARADTLGDLVSDRARTAVPYDPDGDPWHGPTMCVHEAGYVAGVLAGYAALGWPVPADLRALWSWYEAGHWPCAVRGGWLVVY